MENEFNPRPAYRKRPPPFIGLSTSKQPQRQKKKKQVTAPSPLNINPSLSCIEMNSTFYDVLKLKKRRS